MKVFEALERIHEDIDRMADDLLAHPGDSPGRRELFARFRAEVESHLEAIGRAMHGALQRVHAPTDPEDDVLSYIPMHHNYLRNQLERVETAADEEVWRDRMTEVRRILRSLFDLEETTVFSLAHERLSARERLSVLAEYRAARAETGAPAPREGDGRGSSG